MRKGGGAGRQAGRASAASERLEYSQQAGRIKPAEDWRGGGMWEGSRGCGGGGGHLVLHRREIVEARTMTKSAQPDLHARARTNVRVHSRDK